MWILYVLIALLLVLGVWNAWTRSTLANRMADEAKKLGQNFGIPIDLDGAQEDEKLETEADKRRKTRKRNHQAINYGAENWLRSSWRGETKVNKVHKDFICGVGLALFYNSHALPLVAALLAWCLIPESGPLWKDGKKESNPQEDDMILLQANNHAEKMFTSCLKLYLLMFVQAMCHKKMQAIYEGWFSSVNPAMHDVSLALHEVPRSLTNENELKDALQKQISQVKILGVSIAYDYRDHVDEINEMFDIVVTIKDLEHSYPILRSAFEDGPDLKVKGWPADKQALALEYRKLKKEDEQNRGKFRNLFEKIKGSGNAWLVFSSIGDCRTVKQTYNGFWVPTHQHQVHNGCEFYAGSDSAKCCGAVELG
jgi:hypothetical protein